MFISATFHGSLEVIYYTITMGSHTASEFWFFIHGVSILKFLFNIEFLSNAHFW